MNNNFMLAIAIIMGIGLVMAAAVKSNQTVAQPAVNTQPYPTMPPPSQQVQPPIVRPPVNAQPRTYRDAVALSKKQSKQMFLYFGASWCPHCEKMKSQTLQDPSVKSALSKYVVYYVNTDNEKEVSRKYRVSSIPAYAIVGSNERTIKSGKGFKNSRDFKRWLNSNNRFPNLRPPNLRPNMPNNRPNSPNNGPQPIIPNNPTNPNNRPSTPG